GLADQDDLQQLLRRRLEVRQQAHLLEQLRPERLRLVDDQHDAPPLRVSLEQLLVQRRDQRAQRAAGRDRHSQLVEDVLDELARRQLRIQDQRDLGLLGELLEDAADQRRLAGADLAGQLDEAAALGDTVDQMRERIRMAAAQEEIPRIRRDRERLFVKSEKFGIHEFDLDIQRASVRRARRNVTTRR